MAIAAGTTMTTETAVMTTGAGVEIHHGEIVTTTMISVGAAETGTTETETETVIGATGTTTASLQTPLVLATGDDVAGTCGQKCLSYDRIRVAN